MKLIIGLGNPGKKYQQTWHNVGFLALDEIQKSKGFLKFKNNKKIKAEIVESNLPEEKIILAKPQTFMNNSGQTVKTLAKFYKVKPTEVWIIHDDIDLPLGEIRISQNASSGGHKGVQSIINEIGTQQFVRFRIGIKSEKQGQTPTENYVLQKINKTDNIIITESIKKVNAAVDLALMEGIPEAMNQYN